MLKVVQPENETNAHAPAGVGGSLLDELVRDGARAMLAAALQAEVAAYIDAFADQLDRHGHRLMVRNGVTRRAGGDHGGGRRGGAGPAGQRHAHRCSHR